MDLKLTRAAPGRRDLMGAAAAGCAFCALGLQHAMAALPATANVLGEGWERSKYGPDDQIGAANLVTPERVLDALRLPRSGKRVPLGLELNARAPGTPPRKFEHYLIENLGTRHSNLDDFVNGSLNTGTNMDGLAHLGVDGVFYNGHRAEDIAAMDGLRRLGIQNLPPLVTRGVCLDIAAVRGRRLEGGEVITQADVQEAAARQRVALRQGDIVLLHTGWMALWCQDDPAYWQKEPGPGIEAARFLAEDVGVVAVGDDTSRLEADPHERAGLFFPVHQTLLAKNGVYIIENVATQRLIDAGATAPGNSEFCLLVVPLPVTGASQTWVNPVALL